MLPALLGQALLPGGWGLAYLVLAAALGVATLVAVVIAAKYFNLWVQAG
jgi:hypothetical protein